MRFTRNQHDCLPPGGIVFDPTWTCPDCGATWRLEVHANSSEWIQLTPDGAT